MGRQIKTLQGQNKAKRKSDIKNNCLATRARGREKLCRRLGFQKKVDLIIV